MAEIRKHQPHVRDQIDAAIWAALGEDVRPTPPGAGRDSSTNAQREADRPEATSPVTAPTSLGAGWAAVNPAFVIPSPRDDDAE